MQQANTTLSPLDSIPSNPREILWHSRLFHSLLARPKELPAVTVVQGTASGLWETAIIPTYHMSQQHIAVNPESTVAVVIPIL